MMQMHAHLKEMKSRYVLLECAVMHGDTKPAIRGVKYASTFR